MRESVRRLGFRMLEATIRRVFRQVVWHGECLPALPRQPVVVYANHHAFYDAQLIGLVLMRVLGRRPVVWMEALPRFPFLRVLGALPFPPDDCARRARSVRETARRMRADPSTALIYFPEGRLHPIEEGLAPFDRERFDRLHHILPDDTVWWPVAVRITGWQDAHPTALLCGGPLHAQPDGRERARLEALMRRAATADPGQGTVLFRGRRSPHEIWDFSRLGRLFARF